MLVLASISNLLPRPPLVRPGKHDFPSPSRAPWPLAYEGMISWRGVAKKRRAQGLAEMRVKCSQIVVRKQQSWPCGNHTVAGERYSTLTLAALIIGHHLVIS